jgi:hypothetical protein
MKTSDHLKSYHLHPKRFHRGDWKGLWETALPLARKETDTNGKRKYNLTKRDTSSIQGRVVLCPTGRSVGTLCATGSSV